MSKFQIKVTHFFVILSLVIGVFVVSKNQAAVAAVGINRQVNYQGRLLSSSGVPVSDGTYNIKFSIYAASSGGTPLWTSAGTVGSPTGTAVTVTNGLFSIQLGDTGSGQNAFDLDWNQTSLFLGVTINSDAEMSPRKRLTAVPYAFVAETLQGQYASSSVASSGGTLFNLRQQSADAASGDRTALYISTSGTSNALDFLIKASNGSEVFTVSRQGNVTTTGNIATNGNAIIGDASTDALIVNARVNSDIMPFSDNAFVLGTSSQRWRGIDVVNATTTYSTTTNLAVSTYARLPSDTRINNTTVCLSDGTNCATASEVDTLLSVTNRGSVATSSVTFFGGLTTSNLTATGTTSLQNTTFANATGTNVTGTSIYATSLGSSLANITSLNFVSATGTDIRAASGTFTNLTMGSASATALFATSLSFANGTSTSSFSFNNASGSSLSIQGQSVCLANGVNCQVVSLNDMNWTYSLASDLVRNTTSTTDIILGGAATTTAPVFFSLTGENASSNRLVVGQNQNMDVTIGNSTSSGLNAAFQLSGNDLYVEGNIGSATSVYTNGAFIAGSGSTLYGDGFLTKTNGLFTLSSTAGNLQLQTITSGNIVLDPVNGGTGTTTFGGTTSDRLVFTARADSDLLPAADSAYSLGSSSLRWLGLQATNVTSTSIVTNTLLVNGSITVSTTAPTVLRQIKNLSRIDEPQGNPVISGKYAYVPSNGSNNGRLAIVDISTPGNATTVGALTTGINGLQNIAIAGKYIYGTTGGGGGNGLVVINIASSSNPAVVGSTTVAPGSDGIAIAGRYAYVSSNSSPQFVVFDLASSTAPTAVLSYTSSTGLASANGIAVQGPFVYMASNNQFTVFNVSNPATTTVAGLVRDTTNLSLAQYMAVQGGYAYVAAQNRLTIVNITNPAAPTVAGSVSDTTLLAGATNVALAGTIAYVTAATNDKVVAIDVSDPTAPFIVGVLTDGTALDGAYGIAISGRQAYVSVGPSVATSTDGLTVLSLNGYDMVGATIGSLNVGSIYTGESVDVGGHLRVRGGINADGGGILTNGELVVQGQGTSTVYGKLQTFGGIQVDGGDLTHLPSNVFSTSTATSTGVLQLEQVKVIDKFAYATESSLDRFWVFDVSNSNAPLAIANITDSTKLDGALGFAISGSYAYAVAPNTSRLTVIDIHDPRAPLIVNSVTSTNLSTPSYIKIKGRYAYIVQSGSSKPQVTIWDIASSTSPVEVRAINDRGFFDATPNALDIYGNRLYVGGSTSRRFTVVDITNPLTATSTATVASAAGGANGIVAQGRYVYTTGGSGVTPVLNVIDTSTTTPTVSTCLSNFNGNLGAALAVIGNYAYVGLVGGGASSNIGLGIADISNPTTCREVAARTFGNGITKDMAIVGKQLYAARSTGLEIVTLQGLDTPVANIGSIWGGDLNLMNSLTLAGTAFFKNGLSSGSDIVTSGIFISQSTSTSSFAGDIQVNGASVCLSNGVNCPTGSTGDLNWSYSLASDLVRNTTSTTDIIIGGTATTSAPVFFSLLGENASSSRLVIGQNQNMDVTIGSATSSGFNSTFQLSGDDLFVQGNIGSATSVYTNGAFVAGGSASTILGNGFLTALSGDLTLSTPNGQIILDPRDNNAVQLGGTSADYISFTGKVNTDILPLTDANYALGSPSFRWKGLDAVSVTSTSATTTKLYAETLTVSSTITNILDVGSSLSVVTTTGVGTDPNSVVLDGKYLYVTNKGSNSLMILDVTDPANPSIIKTIVTGSSPRGLVVRGGFAYVANTNSNTVTIYDVSVPASSTQVGTVSLSGSPVGLSLSGHYLYVTRQTAGVVSAVDVTNPTRPTLVGSTSVIGDANTIFIQNSLAYVTNFSSSTVSIINVNDPAAMTVVTTTQQIGKVHGLFVQGRYMYLGFTNDNIMTIVDISDPSTPTQVGSVAFGGAVDGIYVAGRYAYVVGASTKLKVFDVSSSTNPILVSTMTVGNQDTNISPLVVGGRYAYIVNTNGSNSVSIIDVHGAEINGLIAHSAELGDLRVRGNGRVNNLFTVNGSLDVGSGGIESHGSLGVYTNAPGIPSAFIFNNASNTVAVLDVRGGCDGTSSTAPLIRAGNITDNTVFKVSCNGYVTADGTYASPATDFAEYLRSSGNVSVQDVLVLDPATTTRRVRRGTTALRNNIIGVYSTKPSFLGGNSEDIQSGSTTDAVPVAMLGQVPTKVNALSQPIQAGDFVMPGDDGYAVKAQGSGMVLGRALENFMSGTGTIDIFVQPVWWAGDILESTSSTDMIVKDLSLQFSNANASSSLVDSPAFVFQGSAWDSVSDSVITSSFTLLNDVISASSSLFSIKGTIGTNLLTISELGNVGVSGDLTVGHRLFLGSKQEGQGSTSTYLFIDDTQTPSSTYVATNADGWSTASTYDYAERFVSNEALQPGDVVMADGNGIERVKRTVSSQDVVLGIVSTKPGFITGSNTTGTYPIALAGRVPTRVSTMNGAIAIGDQVAPSTVPGVAVKAVIGGPVIGIALEGYDLPQEGRISVFVQPGWKGGDIVQTPTSTVNYVPAPSTILISPRSGLAKIFAGATEVSVSFTTLNSFPLISVTPYGLPTAKWGISNVTDHGFKIVLEHPENFDLVMSWKAEPSPQDGMASLSDGTSASYDSLTGELINASVTSSGDTPTIPDVTSTSPEAPTSSEAVPPPDTGTSTDSVAATSSDPVL